MGVEEHRARKVFIAGATRLAILTAERMVEAGISTVLMLAAVARIGRHERPPPSSEEGWSGRLRSQIGALLVVVIATAALLYGARDMPRVGDPQAPATVHPLTRRWHLEVSPDVEGGVWHLWTEIAQGPAATSLDVVLIEPEAAPSPLGTFDTDEDGRGVRREITVNR